MWDNAYLNTENLKISRVHFTATNSLAHLHNSTSVCRQILASKAVSLVQILDPHLLCTFQQLILNSRNLNIDAEVLLYYRPQTKFAKVMFLHVSVSHSVHRGGWVGREVVSQHALQVVSQHVLQQVCRGGVCIPACLAGFQAHTKGSLRGLALGGSPGPHPGGS